MHESHATNALREQFDEFRADFRSRAAKWARSSWAIERLSTIRWCACGRRARAARRGAGAGQDIAGAHAGKCTAFEVSAHSIHARPDAGPLDRHERRAGNARGAQAVEFQPGPIFGNILLADEINRATPKTQSALLEAMQEHSVTVAGCTHRLTEPFFVMATQNPLEMEGTYPLPERQLDRFFCKLLVKFPEISELETIMDRTTEVAHPTTQQVLGGERILAMSQLGASARRRRRAPVWIVAGAGHVSDNALASDMTRRYVRYGAARAAQS